MTTVSSSLNFFALWVIVHAVCHLLVGFFFSKLIFSTSFVEWQTDWIPPYYTGRQRVNAAPLLEYILQHCMQR